MLKCKARYEEIVKQKYWFSEWRQLDPLFEWMEGKQSVSNARDAFRELSAESLGYSLNRIRKLEDSLRIAEKKLKTLSDFINENDKVRQILSND